MRETLAPGGPFAAATTTAPPARRRRARPPVGAVLRAAAIATIGLAAVPAAASATDRFVDPAGTDDTPCVLVDCKTIGYAIGQSVPGDRIVVGPGTYVEQVTLGGGRSLVGGAGGRPTIDGGAGTAVTVNGAGVLVKGLRLRGDTHGVNVVAPATGTEVVDDVFDGTTLNPGGKLAVASGSATLTDNVLQSPAVASGISRGIVTATQSAVAIRRNTVSNLFAAITVSGATQAAPAQIEANTISGVRNSTPLNGTGIAVTGSATVGGNAVEGVPSTSGYGIELTDAGTPAAVVTRGNRVLRMSVAAIHVEQAVAGSSATLSNDIVTNSGAGMLLSGGNPVVTGATVLDDAPYDIRLGSAQTALTLRSSLLGAHGVSGPGSCSISYSRGPSTTGGACQRFQTSAPPTFVAYSDYRIAPTSPLIDAGDPAAPAADERDFDGHPRAVIGTDANRCGPPRRDIGAYELVPAPALVCPPGDPSHGGGTVTVPPGKQTPTVPGTPGVPKTTPPAAAGAIAVIDDAGAAITASVDGARPAAIAARAVGRATVLRPGTYGVRVGPKRGKGKPVTARVAVRSGELGVVVATIVRGKLKLRTTAVARGTRRVLSLLPRAQRVQLGRARARSLRHGAAVAVPAGVTTLTVGRRRLTLAKTAQLTVLVPGRGRVGVVARGA